MRHVKGEVGTKERLPFTKDLLLQLLLQFDRSAQEGMTTYAASCLAIVGFLKVVALTYSTRNWEDEGFSKWLLICLSVRLHDDHLG